MTAVWGAAYPDSGGIWPSSHVVSSTFIRTSPKRWIWID